MVRSPVILYSLPFTLVNDLLLKLSFGIFSASKKSALFRCLSLGSTSVLIEFTSAFSSTTASEKSGFEDVMVASNTLKSPSMSDIFMWVTLNPNLECILSDDQVCANALADNNNPAAMIVTFFILFVFFVV